MGEVGDEWDSDMLLPTVRGCSGYTATETICLSICWSSSCIRRFVSLRGKGERQYGGYQERILSLVTLSDAFA